MKPFFYLWPSLLHITMPGYANKQARRCVRVATLNDKEYKMGRYKQNFLQCAKQKLVMLQNNQWRLLTLHFAIW